MNSEPDRSALAHLVCESVREMMYSAFSHLVEGEEEKVESGELIGADAR